MRDTIGTALISGPGIKITRDDPGDTIEISNKAGASAQTGGSYTLDIDDEQKFVTLNNTTPVVLTIPPNSSVPFAVGTMIEGAQLGSGQVTITPGSGVTVVGAPGLKVAEQYGVFGLRKLGTNSWLAFGRLTS